MFLKATERIMKRTTLILLFLTNMAKGHTPVDGTNSIITISGHQDANNLEQAERLAENYVASRRNEISETLSSKNDEISPQEEAKNDVLFIRNDEIRDEPEYRSNNEVKTLGDIVANIDKDIIQIHTEAPRLNDYVFMPGAYRNDPEIKVHEETKKQIIEDLKRIGFMVENCANLDCNRTFIPVCGGKKEHGKMRFRLFVNECFFRKVNCGFRYNMNHYKEANISRCSQMLTQKTAMPKTILYRPIPVSVETQRPNINRRSFSHIMNGLRCDHMCPATCPDTYDPVCAVRLDGQNRMFKNHCFMDIDSCDNNVVLIEQPLSKCIKRERMEIQNNMRLFSWMQRRGFIDNRGGVIKQET